MQNKLVIFDCYKTLIEAEDIADKSYRMAVKELFDVDGGRTDADPTATTIQSVISQIAVKKGVEQDVITMKRDVILSTYERLFETCVRTGEVLVLPGVIELLEGLQRSQVPLGVYTGDSFRTLDLLLEKSNLSKYFAEDMRSCGSNEAEDRTELLRLAIGKAVTKYKIRFDKSNIYVVDDSWRGIKGAEVLGIKSIGLIGTPQRFERYGVKPTHFFNDLDYKKVLDTILT